MSADTMDEGGGQVSEDYDDITDGPISIERAKHHCGRLAVDCGWRAMEVEMHIDAQAKIIAMLRAEVKAWRSGCSWRFASSHDKGQSIKDAIAATNAAGALEDKP